jgi:hypothetical protein
MNLFQKIKLALQMKNFVKEDMKEATTMNGTKPGWKTTEFWLTVANQVAVVWGAVAGYVPPKYAVIGSAVGTCLYTILRTLAKS